VPAYVELPISNQGLVRARAAEVVGRATERRGQLKVVLRWTSGDGG
jgi:hypothetical protein